MWPEQTHLVPVVHLDTVLVRMAGEEGIDIFVNDQLRQAADAGAPMCLHFLDKSETDTVKIDIRVHGGKASIPGCPVTFRRGGWDGAVSHVAGRFVHGFALDRHNASCDVLVVAYSETGVVAFATAKASEAGAFLLVLPAGIDDGVAGATLRIGIAGSDYCLDGGVIPLRRRVAPASTLTRMVASPIRVAIKISTPNLRVAHEWGDYHFANSLKASFERIGIAASVDTNDVWYEPSRDADVVIALRGRHRVKVDHDKINLMWLISHPDRVEADEYEDYDHVFVASDIYARTLRQKVSAPVSVLHQATDHRLFKPFDDVKRKADCLFVGNSRREYRRMVHWCIEKNIPLSLYGGGWKDVVSPDLVKAENIANSDLAEHYAGHMILLNDHWDTMRDEGFLSNRLFDGSAVGTPIFTDGVRGVSEVFGDTITVVDSPEDLQATVALCLKAPGPFLGRAAQARDIVLRHHTFDHRAQEIRNVVEGLAKFHLRSRAPRAG